MLDGREDLENNKIKDNKDKIRIAEYENFFFINNINRGAISPHSTNFVINIITAKIVNTY
jgi:hypothetical protein